MLQSLQVSRLCLYPKRSLRALINADPESLLLLDEKQVILVANETVAKRLGTTADRLVDMSVYDSLPRDVAKRRRTYVETAIRTRQPVRFEDERLGRYMDNRIHPILDAQGNVTRIAILGVDLTERKQAEERYHLLFNGMLDGFALHEIVCDETGKPVDYRFLEVNPAFERLTGLQARDLIGNSVRQVMPATESYWIDTYG